MATPTHWRLLIAAVLATILAAFVAPTWLPGPGIEENRVLADRPAWPRHLRDLWTLRKTADDYVADRFPPRAHLIGLTNRARMLLGISGSDRVVVGREGYLFFDTGTHLGAARNDPPMDGPAVRLWLSHLAGREEALKSQGIAYLVIAGPTKETVYPQFAPAWFGGPSPERPTVMLPRLAAASGAGDVLYLHQAVAEATREGLKTYSRHDTHWTGYAAYAAYAALIEKLHAMGVTDEPLPFSRFEMTPDRKAGPKDLALMLGVGSLVDVDFPHIANPAGLARSRVEFLTSKQDSSAPQVIETGEPDKPVLLMTRDSFSLELMPLLLPHFSRIVLAHNQDGFWRPDLVERFKPDVVVLETIEHGLPIAMDDGPEPSAAAVARIDGVLRTVLGLKAFGPHIQPASGELLIAMNSARPIKGCSFDIVSFKSSGPGTSTLALDGWISALRWHETSPDGILRIQADGTDLTLPVKVDVPRPDVAAVFHNPAAERSGFHINTNVPADGAGAYRVTIYRKSSNGLLACALSRTIAPQPAASAP